MPARSDRILFGFALVVVAVYCFRAIQGSIFRSSRDDEDEDDGKGDKADTEEAKINLWLSELHKRFLARNSNSLEILPPDNVPILNITSALDGATLEAMPKAYRSMMSRLLDKTNVTVISHVQDAEIYLRNALGRLKIAVTGGGSEMAITPPANSRFYLGLDCEWLPVKKSRVALLQLCLRCDTESSSRQELALFRMHKFKTIGPILRHLLRSREILKTGIGILHDAGKIHKYHGIQPQGCLDLAALAAREHLACKKSLAGMTNRFCGFALPKASRVRCSDWEREHLTPAQHLYAASDAFFGADIYARMLEWKEAKMERQRGTAGDRKESKFDHVRWVFNLLDCPPPKQSSFSRLMKKMTKKNLRRSSVHGSQEGDNDKGDGLLDLNKGCKDPIEQKLKTRMKRYSESRAGLRSKPLYENCRVLHPNGKLMFTCDKRKVDFYLKKGLAKIVSEEKLEELRDKEGEELWPRSPTIQLTFQPKGMGNIGDPYFNTVRKNICVVCGETDRLMRHNVVPYSYRQFFPLAIKTHSSHDIVLTCRMCNAKANMINEELKREMCRRYRVPLYMDKSGDHRERKRVFAAARSLLRNHDKLRQFNKERFEELGDIIREHLGETAKPATEESGRASSTTSMSSEPPASRTSASSSGRDSMSSSFTSPAIASLPPEFTALKSSKDVRSLLGEYSLRGGTDLLPSPTKEVSWLLSDKKTDAPVQAFDGPHEGVYLRDLPPTDIQKYFDSLEEAVSTAMRYRHIVGGITFQPAPKHLILKPGDAKKGIEGLPGVTIADLKRIVWREGMSTRVKRQDKTKTHGYLIVAEVMKRGGGKALFDFQKEWRQHFLDGLQPRHLSKHWSVDHSKPNDVRYYEDGLTHELALSHDAKLPKQLV